MTSYSKNSDQDEYYIEKDGKESYAKGDSGQVYAKKKDGKPFFAKNEHGKQYYAKRKDKSEYYPATKNGRDIFIEDGDTQIYAKSSVNSEIYPRGRDGKEYALKRNNVPYYARDKNQIEMYPKLKSGEEYIIENIYIKTPDGKKKFPTLGDGNPKYPTRGNLEIYPTDDNGDPYFCKNRDGDEIYAKDANGDEYYPGGSLYAKNRHGEYYYATDNLNHILYPRNNIGEIYIETTEGSFYLLKNTKNHFVYARQGAFEIYPISYVDGKKMQMIVDTYAKHLTDGNYYPKDSDSNEYTLPNGEIIPNKGYPITSDGYIIVPNVNNEPKFITGDTSVSHENIVKLLYRPTRYDFLTNIKSKRKTAIRGVPSYKTLDLKNGSKSILYYVIAALALVIIILIAVM